MITSSLGSSAGRAERVVVYVLAGLGTFALGIFLALASAGALAMMATIVGVTSLILVFALFGLVAIAMSFRGEDPVLDALIAFTFLPGLLYLLFADRFDEPSWPGAIAAAITLSAAVVARMLNAESKRQDRWRHHDRKAAARRAKSAERAAATDFFRQA